MGYSLAVLPEENSRPFVYVSRLTGSTYKQFYVNASERDGKSGGANANALSSAKDPHDERGEVDDDEKEKLSTVLSKYSGLRDGGRVGLKRGGRAAIKKERGVN